MPIPGLKQFADILDYGLNTDIGQAITGAWDKAYNSNFGKAVRTFMNGYDSDLTDDEYFEKYGHVRPFEGTTFGDMLTGAGAEKMFQLWKEAKAAEAANAAAKARLAAKYGEKNAEILRNAQKVTKSEKTGRTHFVPQSNKPPRSVKTFTLELPKEMEEAGRSLGDLYMHSTQRYMECLMKGDVEGARNWGAFAQDLKQQIKTQNLAKTGGLSDGFTKTRKDGGTIDLLSYKSGGSINIKPENRGKFTEYCGGKVTEECIARGKRSPDPKIRKQATFTANSRSWNK